MSKIGGYTLVHQEWRYSVGATLMALQATVNQLIDEGWEPIGSLVWCERDGSFTQPMIWSEEILKLQEEAEDSA